jgi:hypothetical protein
MENLGRRERGTLNDSYIEEFFLFSSKDPLPTHGRIFCFQYAVMIEWEIVVVMIEW